MAGLNMTRKLHQGVTIDVDTPDGDECEFERLVVTVEGFKFDSDGKPIGVDLNFKGPRKFFKVDRLENA